MKIQSIFRLVFSLFFFLLTVVGLRAQSIPISGCDFEYKITLDEVDFAAPVGSPSSKIEIFRDYFPFPNISGVAWSSGGVQTPVAFVSETQSAGTKVRVTAKFSGCPQEMWAKGDGPGGYDAPAKKLNSGVYLYTDFSTALTPGKTDFYDPFIMTWFVSTKEDGPWEEVGKSQNPFYVTHKAPSGVSEMNFHSLLYYSCKNAKGLSSPNAIVDNIYDKTFSSRILPRKDQPTKGAMSYWAWPEIPGQNGACYSTSELLMFENGRCGAWASFLLDLINVQGVSGAEESEVTYETPSTNFGIDIPSFFGRESQFVEFYGLQDVFFVKDYNLTTPTLVQNKFFIWNKEHNPIANASIGQVSVGNNNTLTFAPSYGIPGQGNFDPQSTHVNHGIVKYNNYYYDPSYGTPKKANPNSWENASLDAFGMIGFVYVKYSQFSPIAKFYYLMYVNERNLPNHLESTINP